MCVVSSQPHISAVKSIISGHTITPPERKKPSVEVPICTGAQRGLTDSSNHPGNPAIQHCACVCGGGGGRNLN